MKFVFFGSSELSVYVLEELKLHSVLPSLIVTTPDKPKGRKLVLTPNVVKTWGLENNIEVLDPKSLKNDPDLVYKLKSNNYELFLVASYGKIIPKIVFDIPPKKTLNIHPSMLPKYRGASPLKSQILDDVNPVGLSIMQIDERLDTGPVLVQREVSIDNWPVSSPDLERIIAREGARLLVHILPKWLSGALQPIMQDDSKATECGKIEKEDGLLDLDSDPRKNLLKIRAYQDWPTSYFFTERNGRQVRVIVKDAEVVEGKLKLLRVVPEGKKEMSYNDFLRGSR